MQLLARERLRRRHPSPAHGLSCCEEFGARDARPWSRADSLEDRERSPEFVARATAPAQAAKARAEGKMRQSKLEYVGRLFMEADRLRKVALEITVRREHAETTGGARHRPWLSLSARFDIKHRCNPSGVLTK